MAEEKVTCKHEHGFQDTPSGFEHDGPTLIYRCRDCQMGFVAHKDHCLAANRITASAREIIERQTAEWVFLIQRLVDTGGGGVRFDEDRDQGRGRKSGVSSNALIRHVLTGGMPPRSCYPADRWDYAACVRAADDLPPHLKQAASEILDRYWDHLSGREAQSAKVPA